MAVFENFYFWLGLFTQHHLATAPAKVAADVKQLQKQQKRKTADSDLSRAQNFESEFEGNREKEPRFRYPTRVTR